MSVCRASMKGRRPSPLIGDFALQEAVDEPIEVTFRVLPGEPATVTRLDEPRGFFSPFDLPVLLMGCNGVRFPFALALRTTRRSLR